MGLAWVLPNKATKRHGGNFSNMKLKVNSVFLGAAEGLTYRKSIVVGQGSGRK